MTSSAQWALYALLTVTTAATWPEPSHAATVVNVNDDFSIIEIPAALSGWQATGISICTGSRWTLIVQGVANTGASWTSWTTSGGILSPVPFNSGGVLVPEAPPYSLVARVGGTPLYVGGGGRIDAWAGDLELGYNDSVYGDNIGFFLLHMYRDLDCATTIAELPGTDQSHRSSIAVPNPTSGEVDFAFDIPRSGPYDVSIVDVQGRLVRHLHSGVWEAGRRSVHWDATDDRGLRVAPGVYYYAIVSSAGTESKSLIVVR